MICQKSSHIEIKQKLLLRDHHDLPWPHHVQVAWEPYFLAHLMLLGAEQSTVKRLTDENIAQLEAVFGSPKRVQ